MSFFPNSPKLRLELESNIKLTEGATTKKLVSLCKTPWVARIDALKVVLDLLPVVITTLEVISEGGRTGWNAESRKLAENLMTCLTRFQLLMAFIVAQQYLGYIKGLTYHFKEKQGYLPRI